jgi:hypothetical protein
MSKAAIQVEILRLKREDRRQKQTDVRERRDSIDTDAAKSYEYRTSIDKFRLDFARKRAELKIKVNGKKEAKQKVPKIRVCVRKRPLNEKESLQHHFDCMTTSTEVHPFAHIYLHEPKIKLDLTKDVNTHLFRFDHVFDENSTNSSVCKVTSYPLADAFLNGGRATLFAYGQTGKCNIYHRQW